MRKTIRFNDLEELELKKLKTTFNIDDDSKAVKVAINWVNNYLTNVTKVFFPTDYDIILSKKKKTNELNRKVYE